jgi:prepilin-type processing-associated H-X9-DG protein
LDIPWPTRTNFTGLTDLSYSFANPYPNDDAVKAGYKWINPRPQEFVLAADLNPGVDELTKTGPAAPRDDIHKINSPNHLGDGQNALFSDGHVEFDPNPFWGVNRDNIYTFGVGDGAGIIGSPVGPDDSILLPTATQK